MKDANYLVQILSIFTITLCVFGFVIYKFLKDIVAAT
jgi:hypothetical protein